MVCVPDMTYNVFSGTLNPTQSVNACSAHYVLCFLCLSVHFFFHLQGVSDITNITVKDDSGSRRNTNTFIITFKAPSIPKHLRIGYIRVPVSP